MLETWEDMKRLQEEFKTATFETAIATFSTITTVDRLDIAICLDTIRSVAKENIIPVTRRIGASTPQQGGLRAGAADELKRSDRVGKEITRMELDVDYTPQIYQ